MATMHTELVSVERALWAGDAKAVYGRTTEGDLGILPGHVNLLGEIDQAWPIRIQRENEPELVVAVHGGFLSVNADGVAVLAETAEFAQDIDVERARAALARAESDSGYEAEAAKARALARLRAAGESV